MKALAFAAGLVATGSASVGEVRDEAHVVGNALVRITRAETLEVLTVGESDHDQIKVLSGADVEIAALLGDAASVALLGQAVLVAEVTGTHSCEVGDARLYYVVTLGDLPAAEGPVTTCEAMVASVTDLGRIKLEGASEAWIWAPDKGWSVASD